MNLAANFDHFPSGGKTKKHMCPNETLQLECSKLNSLHVYIEWRARDSGSSKFIDVASCNNSQKCTLRGHSQEFDEITVMGVSKGSLIIKRSTRETKKKNLTFACGISDGSTTTWHAVVIDLSTKCKCIFSLWFFYFFFYFYYFFSCARATSLITWRLRILVTLYAE